MFVLAPRILTSEPNRLVTVWNNSAAFFQQYPEGMMLKLEGSWKFRFIFIGFCPVLSGIPNWFRSGGAFLFPLLLYSLVWVGTSDTYGESFLPLITHPKKHCWTPMGPLRLSNPPKLYSFRNRRRFGSILACGPHVWHPCSRVRREREEQETIPT